MAEEESEKPINVITKYFVPPTLSIYTEWGLMIGVLLMLPLMFGLILYTYVSLNYSDYYNRIAMMSHSYLFGRNPQSEFDKYVSNTQANAISTAMNNIKSSSDDIVNASNRMNDSSARIAKQMMVDIPNSQDENQNLGNVMQNQVSKLVHAMNNMVSNVYMSSVTSGPSLSAISTVQPSSTSTPKS